MDKSIEIILPKIIPILRERPNQDIKIRPEEFSLYFKNFIHPIYPWFDIQVECNYGQNLGECWRLCEYPDEKSFDLTVKIYDEFGNLIAQKSTIIELYDSDITELYRIICVGDSMTNNVTYVRQMQMKLKNVFTCGTRSYDGHVFCEGRGGWSYNDYFKNFTVTENGNSVSPFLFPKEVEGSAYFGDLKYFNMIDEKNRSTYNFDGFLPQKIKDGQYYYDDGKLFKYGEDETKITDISWEFSFLKYLERNNLKNINAVSVLMGANDLQVIPYEKTEEAVKEFIKNTRLFVKAVKEADDKIDVILNLPICGAEQYAWGKALGCVGGEKLYAHNMRSVSRAIIDEFENESGVYICPMLCCIDPKYGFEKTSVSANLYNDTQLEKQANWVHPSVVGYKQMGDVLAGTVEMLRHKNQS